jgi:RNA polymerase sigma factor (sigma-70 family)
MARPPLEAVVRHLRKIADVQMLAEAADGQLLERYIVGHEELAFAALLRRHGPMVLGVCRGVLGQREDAEDAFQATFLLLARKASSIRKRDSVASWLHGTAYRLAVRAKTQRALRRSKERQAPTLRIPDPRVGAAWQELCPLLHEEVEKLPEKYRTALLLFYWEGKTQDEVARELACPMGTVQSRLGRGRKLLQQRLTRRGLALSAGSFTAFLVGNTASAAIPAQMLDSTLKACLQIGSAAVSAPVAVLVEEGLKAMFWAKLKVATTLLLALSVATGLGAWAHQVLDIKPSERRENTGTQRVAKLPHSADPTQAGLDRNGEPLPAGAVARLGTVRFRHVVAKGLVFSPDGKNLVSSGGDMVLRFWDVETGKQRRMFVAQPLGAGTFAFSPDRKLLATANRFDPNVIQLWEAATDRKIRELRPAIAANQVALAPSLLAFSPDGHTLASSRADARISLWDVATGQELFNLPGHQTSKFDWQNAVNALAFSPDGQWLVSSGQDGLDNGGWIRVWERATGKQAFVLRCPEEPVTALAFAPNSAAAGNRLVSGGYLSNSSRYRGKLRLWDLKERKQLREFKKDGLDGVVAVAISPDGTTLASGCKDKSVQLWNRADGELRCELRGHRDNFMGLYSLAFSPNGNMLAAGGNDNVIYFWDVTTGKRLFQDADAQESTIRSVVLSADGKSLSMGSLDGTISVWDWVAGTRLFTNRNHEPPVELLMLSPQRNLLAANGADGTIRLLEATTGKELRRLRPAERATERVVCAAFSRDGKLLASGHAVSELEQGCFFCIWDVATGKQLRQIKNPNRRGVSHFSLAFSPDSERLTVACGDGTLRQWEVATGKELTPLPSVESAFGAPVS